MGSKLSNGKRRRLNEERGKVVLATSFRSRYVEKKGGKKERNMKRFMGNRTLPEFLEPAATSLSKTQSNEFEDGNNQICVYFKLYPSLSNV